MVILHIVVVILCKWGIAGKEEERLPLKFPRKSLSPTLCPLWILLPTLAILAGSLLSQQVQQRIHYSTSPQEMPRALKLISVSSTVSSLIVSIVGFTKTDEGAGDPEITVAVMVCRSPVAPWAQHPTLKKEGEEKGFVKECLSPLNFLAWLSNLPQSGSLSSLISHGFSLHALHCG